MNRWLDALTDPRRQELCVYLGRHIWWQIMLTFILRGGSKNAFDGDRKTCCISAIKYGMKNVWAHAGR